MNEAFELFYYQTHDGGIPFREWLATPIDPVAYAAVQSRTDRLRRVVLLLCGGDKRKQTADIKRAKRYWRDYEKRLRPAGRSV